MEYAATGMGWSDIVADVTMILDYEAEDDMLMMGFFSGQVAIGSPLMAIENYNFFAELWNTPVIDVEYWLPF